MHAVPCGASFIQHMGLNLFVSTYIYGVNYILVFCFIDQFYFGTLFFAIINTLVSKLNFRLSFDNEVICDHHMHSKNT